MSLALSSCHYVLRPRPGLGQASGRPRAGLGEPRSAPNANKPASSWPLKQGRKKCSNHGCDRGTSTVVAQPSTGFLNGSFYPDGSPTEDTEDCLGRITVRLTRSKSLTLLASPLDMMGLMGMAQVIAAIAYGIQGLRRGARCLDSEDSDNLPGDK